MLQKFPANSALFDSSKDSLTVQKQDNKFTGSAAKGRRAARVIQITDCHLGQTPEYCLAGVSTLNSFREVLARIIDARDTVDMVVASGDISAHGSEAAYRAFIGIMDRTELPYSWLPGNHDDFQLMLDGVDSSPYWPMLELSLIHI